MKYLLMASFLTASLFVISNCARNPVTGKKEVVLMSEAQEIEMGKAADPEVIQQFGLYEDSSLQNYINSMGQRMAAISHRPGLEYHFRVINSDVVNAFAVPGGYVYFTRGIMAYLNSEAQFAGVLGHEIGHITARHSVKQQRNQILASVGLIAGMIISPELARFGETASQGLGLLLLKYGRDAERQSDELGVDYSAKIGYDPQYMADFFQTLERQSAQNHSEELPPFLSTHPSPEERYATIKKLAAKKKQELNNPNLAVGRNEYLRRIEGLIYGEDPKEGFLENGVFYHPPLGLQFTIPTNWAYQNTPQQVQLASRDGKALMIFTLAQGKTLDEAANNVLQQYKLQLVNSNRTTINGNNAIVMIADLQQQQGSLRTLSYLVQHGDNIYLMIGVSALNDFPAYDNILASSMKSFRTLTDPTMLNKKPQRVRIKTVGQTGTLQQVLRFFGVADKRLEEHAILNGMQLTESVPSGTLIKVIGE
ncbi:MAG: M48 family metalloprotease [Flavisolibacter sp.]|nr:M48 family metalloprotease [Flavisolibacter sp.]